jgi:preprotein translocase subunit SecF
MFTQASFIQYTQWFGIATIALAVFTAIAFIFKWGFRFRIVGTTGFMIVLTAGLFSLSLVPISRTVIPGAVKYTLVYDTGASQTVIAVSPNITPTQLEATLRQAASNLYSNGRLGNGTDKQLTVRARTVIHPEKGLSVPLYLGQVKHNLENRNDSEMTIEIYKDKFAQLPKPMG